MARVAAPRRTAAVEKRILYRCFVRKDCLNGALELEPGSQQRGYSYKTASGAAIRRNREQDRTQSSCHAERKWCGRVKKECEE